jgi:hypothetical protein
MGKYSISGILGLIGLALSIIAPSTSQAAPVTFQFEAEITEIVPSADVNFSLPSEITIGGIFDGSVTYEPPAFFGLDTHDASLRSSLEAISFFANQLPLITDNDTGGTTGNSTVVNDIIRIQCDSTAACGNYSSNSPNLIVLDFALGLIGNSDAINPLFETGLDPDAWNRLTNSRKLFLKLTSSTGMGTYAISANVGGVRSVPEAASLSLGAFVLLLAIYKRRPLNIIFVTFSS